MISHCWLYSPMWVTWRFNEKSVGALSNWAAQSATEQISSVICKFINKLSNNSSFKIYGQWFVPSICFRHSNYRQPVLDNMKSTKCWSILVPMASECIFLFAQHFRLIFSFVTVHILYSCILLTTTSALLNPFHTKMDRLCFILYI